MPPGQYVTEGFRVRPAGPTPHTPLPDWTFSIRQGGKTLKSWTWQEFQARPTETPTVDIHCVTRWSELDTVWRGVSVDTLLDQVEHDAPYVLAFCDGGYTTNLPIEDITGGQAWVAFDYDGQPPGSEHGGPARLLVPHLYFGKSAKWAVQHLGVRLIADDGYQAERQYPIAPAPGEPVAITHRRRESLCKPSPHKTVPPGSRWPTSRIPTRPKTT